MACQVLARWVGLWRVKARLVVAGAVRHGRQGESWRGRDVLARLAGLVEAYRGETCRGSAGTACRGRHGMAWTGWSWPAGLGVVGNGWVRQGPAWPAGRVMAWLGEFRRGWRGLARPGVDRRG
jgi:hypothetical protein